MQHLRSILPTLPLLSVVGVALAVSPPAYDVQTENTASLWGADAENATATIVDEAYNPSYPRVIHGSYALEFVTDGGFDTWMWTPYARNADWDLSDCVAIYFWIYPENPSAYNFQSPTPWVRIGTGSNPSTDYYQYSTGTAMLNEVCSGSDGTWLMIRIPLAGSTFWQRTQVGSPDLSDIDWFEIHADTWDAGFTLYIDGLEFETLPGAGDDPDLNVTYIERTPRYDYDAAKNNPDPGDTVTFNGHVVNWGPAASNVTYRWLLDGSVVASGTIASMSAYEEVVLTRNWTWQDGDHDITLEVDYADAVTGEISETNNAVTVRTNGLMLGLWVEESLYYYMRLHQHEFADGRNSWEDWAQMHVAKHNAMCEEARWRDCPQGALDRWRLDQVVVADDNTLPLSGGLPTNNPDSSDKTVDLMWGFPETNSNEYYDHTSVWSGNHAYFNMGLIHELGHARYLVDSYGYDIHNTASSTSVDLWEGATYVGGSVWMPFLAWGEVLHYNENGGVMSGEFGVQYSPFEVGAFNQKAGQRACCGNMNSPGDIGVYLNDLPTYNHVRFTDENGTPIVGASVEIYCPSYPAYYSWYGKYYDDTADFSLTTDASGYVTLPQNPFTQQDGYGAIVHGYPYSNAVIIARIASGSDVWYRFIESATFTMAYWRGETTNAYYTIALATDSPQWGYPYFIGEPASQTLTAGETAIFNAKAVGEATLSYQWRKNASNIAGATSERYVISSVSASDAGTYDCVVTNSWGSVTCQSATLTLGGGVVTLLEDDFEGGNFSNWTDGGTTDWDLATSQYYSASHSAHAGSSDNDLVSDNLDTSGKSSITISFWYREDDIDDSDNIYLQLYNGSSYVNKYELGLATEDTWSYYETTINNSGADTAYFISNFRIKFEGSSIDYGENLWIDDVVVTAQ